jgi:mannose/cellobiose epimerase-like protein (N-acyl-D-glucosamine 2-epimerase family)
MIEPEAVMRAAGIVKAIIAKDEDLATAIMTSTLDPEVSLGPDDRFAWMRTFYAVGLVAAVAIATLTPDVEEALGIIARHIFDDFTMPGPGRFTASGSDVPE